MSITLPSANTQSAPSGSDSLDSTNALPLTRIRPSGGNPPRLLYVSTLDRIISVMFPHLDAARAAGWQVEVACQPTVYRADLARHADAVHELPLKRFPLHPANGVALQRLVDLIRKGNYHIVHCHNPTGGFVGRLATTLARTSAKRVYTAHGFHFHRHGGRISNAVYRTAESIAGHFWSDAVLTITEEDFRAASSGVVPKPRLFLTGGVGVSAQDDFDPTNVSPADIAAFRNAIGAPASVPVITMIGELIPRKRPLDALEAFVRVRQQHPEALLVLVGDGSLLSVLQARAKTLGIDTHTRFLGFRRDIQTILAGSDIFLFPSGQEGLPCAVQEALSMGIPVVATDVRGCNDLVDNSCGRLAAIGDIVTLADQVCALLAYSREERAAMGATGRKKMLSLYDRDACVRHWQEIYCHLLNINDTEI